MVGLGLWLGGKAGQTYRQITSIAKNFMTPLAVTGATNACARLDLGIDALIGLAEIEIPTVQAACSLQSVCTETGTQVVGSTSSNGTMQGPDGSTIETVDVVGVQQQVCTDSEVVLVGG